MPSTIDITIKTLDGNSRKFENISSEMTVRELKDKIGSRVNIAADKQRLIHAGKVLNDNNTLSSYNLDGQAIHLVEKQPVTNQPPPSGSSGTGVGANNTAPHHHHHHIPRQSAPTNRRTFRTQHFVSLPRGPSTTTQPIPPIPFVNVGASPGMRPPNSGFGRPAHTLVDAGSNRVEHCRRFINNAKHVLRHLRRLKGTLNGTVTENSEDLAPEDVPTSSSMPTEQPSESNRDSDPSIVEHSTSINMQSDNATTSETTGDVTSEEQNANSSQNSTSSRRGTMPRAYRAHEIIDLHRSIFDCEHELQEYVVLCERIFARPPTEAQTVNNETNRQSSHSRLIHGVGEATHFLAHAQHTLSDLFTDLSQNPPLALAHPTPMTAMTAIEIAPMIVHENGPPQTGPSMQIPLVPAHFAIPRADFPSSNPMPAPTTQSNPVNNGNSANAPNVVVPPTIPNNVNVNHVPAFVPTSYPMHMPQISMLGSPQLRRVLMRASWRGGPIRPGNSGNNQHSENVNPTLNTQPPPYSFEPNGTTHTNEPITAESNGVPPQTTESTPNNQNVFSPRTGPTNRARMPISTPRDPFVPCSSRFFQSSQPPRRQNTAAGSSSAGDSGGNSDAGNELQNIMQSFMGGANSGVAVEVNQNVVAVDPNRPIAEQIQDILNGMHDGNDETDDGNTNGVGQVFTGLQLNLGDDQYTEEHESGIPSSQNADPNSGAGVNFNLQNVNNTQELLRTLLGMTTSGGAGNDASSTLYDMFRWAETDSPSVINDLTTVVSRNMTLPDVFTILAGNSQPWVRVRAPLKQYISENILEGNEYSEDLMRRRLHELVERDANLSFSTNITFLENVNGVETARRYFEQRLFDLCTIGLDDDLTNDEYAENVYSFFDRMRFELVALFGQIVQSSESVLTFFTDTLMNELSQNSNTAGGGGLVNLGFMQNILRSVINQQFTALSLAAPLRVNQSQIEQFIVRIDNSSGTNQQMSTDSALPQSSNQEPLINQDVQMDCESSQSQTSSEISHPEPVRSKIKTNGGNSYRNSFQNRLSHVSFSENEPELNLFDPENVASYSSNWETVLEKDAQTQNSETFPRYFSDAYLIGMPARHRAFVSSNSHLGLEGSPAPIARQALANLQPHTIPEESRRSLQTALTENEDIAELFTEVLRDDFRRRFDEDEELHDRPSTRKFCGKK